MKTKWVKIYTKEAGFVFLGAATDERVMEKAQLLLTSLAARGQFPQIIPVR